MINALDHGLQRIKDTIPEEILEAVFGGQNKIIDENIKQDVIYKTVVKNCNLQGGKVIQVQLQQDWCVNPTGPDAYSLYEIPLEYREGRNIVEVHEITQKSDTSGIPPFADGTLNSTNSMTNSMTSYNSASFGGNSCCVTQQHSQFIQNGVNGLLNSKVPSTNGYPIPYAMGHQVRLLPGYGTHVNWWLTMRLCYDNEMTNLNSSAIRTFTRLCELATKRYCYNDLILKIQKGQYEFGMELSEVKNIIDRWGDLNDQYDRELANFSKGSFTDVHNFLGVIGDML